MSSTTSSPSGFLSSPRSQRRLMWISGAVLVIGVVVLLAVIFSRGGNPPTAVSTIQSQQPTQTSQSGSAKAPAAPAALQVARTFLETAVVRKNLDAAYGIVGPFLKGGISLKQWRTGNIPVQPYPAMNAGTAQLVKVSSTKNELELEVVLNPQAGSGLKSPQAFEMRIDRIGGKWLVNAFTPLYQVPHHPTPGN